MIAVLGWLVAALILPVYSWRRKKGIVARITYLKKPPPGGAHPPDIANLQIAESISLLIEVLVELLLIYELIYAMASLSG